MGTYQPRGEVDQLVGVLPIHLGIRCIHITYNPTDPQFG